MWETDVRADVEGVAVGISAHVRAKTERYAHVEDSTLRAAMASIAGPSLPDVAEADE